MRITVDLGTNVGSWSLTHKAVWFITYKLRPQELVFLISDPGDFDAGDEKS